MPAYDAIVLGVGGVGSAALMHLAKRGRRVLGLDQFPPGHDRGSSHGHTRVIRQAYFEHPDYVPLLREAYRLWDELDAARGKSKREVEQQIAALQPSPPVLSSVRTLPPARSRASAAPTLLGQSKDTQFSCDADAESAPPLHVVQQDRLAVVKPLAPACKV